MKKNYLIELWQNGNVGKNLFVPILFSDKNFSNDLMNV